MGSILNPIDDLVAWLITHIYGVLSPVFGAASGLTWFLTIALLVVLMRLIMVPLFIKQMHTQRAMTALTPRISELRKKHKGDKEKLNAETMKLYQEAGVNPLMGCLPVALQMPIFFALFSVLKQIAEWSPGQPLKYHLTSKMILSAQQAKIFGATIADKVLFTKGLHVPLEAKAVILVVVLISMTTTYLTVRQSMKRGMMPTGSDNPMGQTQKYMAYVMPLFALTGLYWPFGLVLYWVTTNVWTLGQQFVLLRKFPVGAAAMGPLGNMPIGGAAGKPQLTGGSTGGGANGKPGPATPRGGASGKPGSAGPATPRGAANGKPGSAGPATPRGAANGKTGSDSPATPRAGANGKAGSDSPATPRGAGNGKPGSAGPATPRGAASGKAGSDSPITPSAAGDGKAKPGGSSGGGPVASGSANGHGSASPDGGLLRRFGRGRSEPELPVSAEPEAKLVRQQRQRQPRSKRSGKR